MSVKTRVRPHSIREFVTGILAKPAAVAALRSEGMADPVPPIVFGITLDRCALDAARKARLGLWMSASGMRVEPALWSLEEGDPSGRTL